MSQYFQNSIQHLFSVPKTTSQIFVWIHSTGFITFFRKLLERIVQPTLWRVQSLMSQLWLNLSLVLFQVRVAEEMGSSHRDGSLLLSYIGIGSGVGKIIFGKISDIPRVDTIKLYNICMVLSGLSPLLAIYSAGYDMLVLYVVVLGLLDGCFIGLMSIVTFQCTDREKMSVAWGAVLMIMSFSMLVGAPAAGKSELNLVSLALSLPRN